MLLIWLYLLLPHRGVWRERPGLARGGQGRGVGPAVRAVISDRDKADVIERAVASLMNQTHPGDQGLIVVEDASSDGMPEIVRALAMTCPPEKQRQFLCAAPRPAGWSGRLWALHGGIALAETAEGFDASPLLLTDADEVHDRHSLAANLEKIGKDDRDLVSLVAHVRVTGVGKRLLIPPFVLFFQKPCSFPAVNEPGNAVVAAGGCVFLRRRRDAFADADGLAAPAHLVPFPAWLGLVPWIAMSAVYRPVLLLYRQPIVWLPTLPLAAFLYILMTIGSAIAEDV